MKTAFLTAVMATSLISTAHAEAAFVEGCRAYRGLAFIAMSGRQLDNNMAKTIKEMGISQDASEVSNRISLSLVQEAYSQPRKFTDDERYDVIGEFSNQIYDSCIYLYDDGTSTTIGRGAIDRN